MSVLRQIGRLSRGGWKIWGRSRRRMMVVSTMTIGSVGLVGLCTSKGSVSLNSPLWGSSIRDQTMEVPNEWSVPTFHEPLWLECIVRVFGLALNISPLLVSAPFALLLSIVSPSVMEWWWEWATVVGGSNGPTLAKYLQWAATRRDLFPKIFCDRMSKLHANVPIHDWDHTEATLTEVFGSHWRETVEIDPVPIGSGCVAQVYHGRLVRDLPIPRNVAVKIVHPGVKKIAEVDLSLLCRFATLIDYLLPLQDVISLRECVEEFSILLLPQMDMKVEAFNLVKFRQNFSNDPSIQFPKPHPDLTSEHILIESYADGLPATSPMIPSSDRHRLARRGVSAFLQMVFRHNFIHGDLHPGNVLFEQTTKHIVFLDAGIAFAIDKTQVKNLVDLFRAVVQGKSHSASLSLSLFLSLQRTITNSPQKIPFFWSRPLMKNDHGVHIETGKKQKGSVWFLQCCLSVVCVFFCVSLLVCRQTKPSKLKRTTS